MKFPTPSNGWLILAWVSLLFSHPTVTAAADLVSPSALSSANSESFEAEPSAPITRSYASLVLDITDGVVVMAKRSDIALPVASITKLMTALVVLESGQPLDEQISITTEDQIVGKSAFSQLTIGTRLSRGELLRLALMSSENQAAHVLARRYPGGLSTFVHAMNSKAWGLGMMSAHFVDPTGLSSENVVSAEDLARLIVAASHNLTIQEYSTTEDYAVQIGEQSVVFRNTNQLLSDPTWNVIVQKTGFLQEAGRCLVMQTVIQKHTFVLVLLNSADEATRLADAWSIRRWVETSPTPSVHTAASISH